MVLEVGLGVGAGWEGAGVEEGWVESSLVWVLVLVWVLLLVCVWVWVSADVE